MTRDYPLDLMSPARHIATRLEGAAPAALTIEELAATYRHPNTGDISRARREAKVNSEEAANRWLIEQALAELRQRGGNGTVQLVQDGDGWRFADGITFDDLRFDKRKLHREIDAHAVLRDPFNPMSGRFSDNVRRNTGKDSMDELRESMRNFGWVPELPAIKDERGVVLVGHRRLAIAAELGITPVIKPVRLGDGDEADAKRFALAIASNLGAKPFTPEERKEIAEYLYGERDWSQQKIADALQVSQRTISSDLEATSNSTKRGRPPKTPRKATPELNQEVKRRVEAGEPISRDELAQQFDVGEHTVQLAQQRAIGAIEEREHQQQVPAPPAHTCTCPTCGDVHRVS